MGKAGTPSPEIGRGNWAGGKDWVTLAVERGSSGVRGPTTPGDQRTVIREARELLKQARMDGAFRASLPHTLELVERHPDVEILQVVAARMILEGSDLLHALAGFRAVLDRFPACAEAFRLYVRLVRRQWGMAAASAVIDEHFPGSSLPLGEVELLMLSAGLEETERMEEAERALELVTELAPRLVAGWRELARLQEKRGALHEAQRTLEHGARRTGESGLATRINRLRRNIQTLEAFSGRALGDVPMQVTAIDFILRSALRRRTGDALGPLSQIGPVMLIGGSLGSGGAERQLVTMAKALKHAADVSADCDGVDLLGPVEVCVRSLNPRQGNDFFAHTLEADGIRLSNYMKHEPYGGRIRDSFAREFCAAIEFLPPRSAEGMTQLVDHLREAAPDVVQIWQDGMILAAGLAALVANVPRIVLMVRTLPPTERVNRWKLEFEPLYRGLLHAPGVILVANSAVAARGYERWLGLPAHSVPVIHNGVAPLAPTPGPDDEQRWRAFEARAGSTGFTVAGVMRLDQNKRPLDWLDIAAHVCAERPEARFVLVGDGPLADEAADYAARLGLHDRVFFVGRSPSVGFWLSKSDALLLTSRFEGTPNVLIEAQMAGVPVVTTPAGGAAETLRHGLSGYVLDALETIDPREAARRLLEIAGLDDAARLSMREAARTHAAQNFGIEAMLGKATALMAMDMSRPILSDSRAQAIDTPAASRAVASAMI